MSYIVPNIIAMGFPSVGMEGVYRNHMNDVKRFFSEKHSDRVKVYNLCTERIYEPKTFKSQDNRFKFDDHHPPPFIYMYEFCKDLDRYLARNSENVAAIHCKAGKGRTGVMICCYLVYSGHCSTAYEALLYYGNIRTRDGKGVTIPSQIRYVYYFEHFLKS